ncbi:uncharacterized protein CLUP02_13158 [Colletotrichum lupini]|uniref:Uncharacterized protein n=1 Tax=Colletotrichum lupini TaxID=145971 RepID=A0A9Q8T2K1_9PEZI|nr:uncharacterized protein CLUP02_13158 [Colletotrichum lupini]UQC87640.1 hypothetical protein CLUP02_13158 [Colletotrichum lupini]
MPSLIDVLEYPGYIHTDTTLDAEREEAGLIGDLGPVTLHIFHMLHLARILSANGLVQPTILHLGHGRSPSLGLHLPIKRSLFPNLSFVVFIVSFLLHLLFPYSWANIVEREPRFRRPGPAVLFLFRLPRAVAAALDKQQLMASDNRARKRGLQSHQRRSRHTCIFDGAKYLPSFLPRTRDDRLQAKQATKRRSSSKSESGVRQ